MKARAHSTQHNNKVSNLLIAVLWVMALAGVALWLWLVYYIVFIYRFSAGSADRTTVYFGAVAIRVTYLTICLSGIYLLVRTRISRPTFYFSFFATSYALFQALERLYLIHIITNPGFREYFLPGVVAFYQVLLVRMMQEFPRKLDQGTIKAVFKRGVFARIVSRLLSWFLKPYRVWVLILLISTVELFTVNMGLAGAIACCILATGYIIVHLRRDSSHNKTPVYWILWATILQLLWSFFLLTLVVMGWKISSANDVWINALLNLSILGAYLMTVYFSDFLDVRVVLQKTFVFGGVIFLFTVAFGIAEHVMIHHLSHYFHLADVYVSSTFACLIGMSFHPLQKKLSGWIKHLVHMDDHHS